MVEIWLAKISFSYHSPRKSYRGKTVGCAVFDTSPPPPLCQKGYVFLGFFGKRADTYPSYKLTLSSLKFRSPNFKNRKWSTFFNHKDNLLRYVCLMQYISGQKRENKWCPLAAAQCNRPSLHKRIQSLCSTGRLEARLSSTLASYKWPTRIRHETSWMHGERPKCYRHCAAQFSTTVTLFVVITALTLWVLLVRNVDRGGSRVKISLAPERAGPGIPESIVRCADH